MVFGPIFQSALRGSKTKWLIFFIGASAIKKFVRPRIGRYRLPKDILSKGQKNKGGGAYSAHPHGRKGCSAMQSCRSSFRSDVVLESVNMAIRDKDTF